MPKPKIVVIDDDPLVIRWVRAVLGTNFAIISQTEVHGVGALVIREQPALVVLDLSMPLLTGEDLVSVIRESRIGRATPIVLFSGAPTEELTAAAARCGADGFIPKNGDVATFMTEVEAAIRRGRRPSDLAVEINADAPPQPAEPGSVASAARRQVVVADPNETFDLSPILARSDLSVIRASTGEEACELIRTHAPALLVVADDLPDTSAVNLISTVRNKSDLRTISILYAEPATSAKLAGSARFLGANIHLSARFTDADLTAAVAKLIEVAPRRAVRLLVRAEVRCQTEERFLVGFTRNLSASGMLLELPFEPITGQRLGARFFLSETPGEMLARCEIVRVHERNARVSAVGVRFEEISPEHVAAIEAFLARMPEAIKRLM